MSFITKAINVGEYVLIRHKGELTREEFEEGRSSAKRILDEQRWNKILVDMRGVVNRVPTVDVFYFIESNTKVLPYVKIGLLFPSERQEEGNFAENVALNRGIQLRAFVSYRLAEAWLTDNRYSA